MVRVDRLGGIAATFEIVSNIKLQLRIPRIGSAQDLFQLLRMLTQRSHVIVVAQSNPQVGGTLADFGYHVPQSFVIGALDRANFRGWAVVELDSVPDKSRTPKESATISKKYLEERLGLTV